MSAAKKKGSKRPPRSPLAKVLPFAPPRQSIDALEDAIGHAMVLGEVATPAVVDAAMERLQAAQSEVVERFVGHGDRGFVNPLLALRSLMDKIPRLALAMANLRKLQREAPHATADVIDLSTVRLAMRIARRRGAR